MYIAAKNIILFILSKIGCDGAAGKVRDFRGSIIDQMPMEERMTLSNMAIDRGAMCGVIPPDETTRQYLQNCGQDLFEDVGSDPEASYEQIYQFDLSDLEPQVARTPKRDKVIGISKLGEIPITKAFIGSCTWGKLFDLAQAAEVLEGRRIALHYEPVPHLEAIFPTGYA